MLKASNTIHSVLFTLPRELLAKGGRGGRTLKASVSGPFS
jgi:hypothetical protein